MNFRHFSKAEDSSGVRRIIESTGFFNREEAEIAVELVLDSIEKGGSSDYKFIYCELDGRVIGYSCYGRIGGTESSYDLYWIAVDGGMRGRGIGKAVLLETFNEIKKLGGGRIYAETSSRQQYEPTRRFYLSSGFFEEAFIKEFYGKNDGKLIYTYVLEC